MLFSSNETCGCLLIHSAKDHTGISLKVSTSDVVCIGSEFIPDLKENRTRSAF
jgi:hypothetical protein